MSSKLKEYGFKIGDTVIMQKYEKANLLFNKEGIIKKKFFPKDFYGGNEAWVVDFGRPHYNYPIYSKFLKLLIITNWRKVLEND